MFFSTGALGSRSLKDIIFDNCQFQPTSAGDGNLQAIEFWGCEFERIEISRTDAFSGCTFTGSSVDSLVVFGDDELLFDPDVIALELKKAGAALSDDVKVVAEEPVVSDTRLRVFERFLRDFCEVRTLTKS